jgi:Thiol:disulfide interchange protein DsbD, N-terminal
MRSVAKLGLLALLSQVPLLAQDLTVPKAPSVSMSPPALMSIHAGKPGQVELRFHVVSGFHINSNTPKSEFLIPTVLKLDPPTDIMIGKVTYPKGEELSFPFAPDEKLSVYSGTFTVSVVVHPLHDVVPIKYMMRGNLRYQACDKAACYPPKNLPVQFEVKVAKPVPTAGRRNPAQSPHIHKPQQ